MMKRVSENRERKEERKKEMKILNSQNLNQLDFHGIGVYGKWKIENVVTVTQVNYLHYVPAPGNCKCMARLWHLLNLQNYPMTSFYNIHQLDCHQLSMQFSVVSDDVQKVLMATELQSLQ